MYNNTRISSFYFDSQFQAYDLPKIEQIRINCKWALDKKTQMPLHSVWDYEMSLEPTWW